MDDQEDLKLTQEILSQEDPKISYEYTFYVLVVPDDGQIIVERVGTLLVVTKGALEATKELISDKYPGSKIVYELPKALRRQAERLLAKARKKREWHKDYLKTVVQPLYSPGIGLAKSDSPTNPPQSPEKEDSPTSDTTTQTDS